MAEVPEVMIALAGGSRSGKTTQASRLGAEFGDELTAYPFDDLFVDLSQRDDLVLTDLENPAFYRWDDYRQHIAQLKLGQTVTLAAHSRESTEEGVTSRVIEPRPIIVVAGFLALYDEQVNKSFDTSVYIDLSEDEIVRRRLATATPGDPWDTMDYIAGSLLPSHREFVEPQRKLAEHVVDGTLPPERITEVLAGIIRQARAARL